MPAAPRATNFTRRTPRLSVDDEENAFTLRAELPGVTAESLDLSVGDDWIELSAKREPKVPEGYTTLRRERGAYEFQRRIHLSKRIDGDKVEATLRDGLLTVTLPKHASVQPRQVSIKAA
jgi:HSP20 family protein